MNVDYNAYVHARPDGGVFYVGKGSTKRSLDFKNNRNNHYLNIVKKHGSDNILVGCLPCSSEEISFDLEKGLIKCLRRMGVELANRTDGGEGVSGYRFDSTQRQVISVRTKEALADKAEQLSVKQSQKWADQSYREHLTAAITRGVRLPEFREARRQQMTGVKWFHKDGERKQTKSEEEVLSLLNSGYLPGKGRYKLSQKAYTSAQARWTPEERAKQSLRTKAYHERTKGNGNGN
jgi:hypothetical protein